MQRRPRTAPAPYLRCASELFLAPSNRRQTMQTPVSAGSQRRHSEREREGRDLCPWTSISRRSEAERKRRGARAWRTASRERGCRSGSRVSRHNDHRDLRREWREYLRRRSHRRRNRDVIAAHFQGTNGNGVGGGTRRLNGHGNVPVVSGVLTRLVGLRRAGPLASKSCRWRQAEDKQHQKSDRPQRRAHVP